MARSIGGPTRADVTQGPTIRQSAISSHIGNICSCDACVIAISLRGLWAGLLRFAFLPAARATVDCEIDGCTGSRGYATFWHDRRTRPAFDNTTREVQS